MGKNAGDAFTSQRRPGAHRSGSKYAWRLWVLVHRHSLILCDYLHFAVLSGFLILLQSMCESMSAVIPARGAFQPD
jgi:hypothetical protein